MKNTQIQFQQFVQPQQQTQIRKSLLIKIKMIDNSSKRLSRIKKKLNKNENSDYHFLISSLQRDSNKQNHASNHLTLNKTSLKNSVQLIKSSMANSFDNFKHFTHGKHFDNSSLHHNAKQCTKINIRNSHSNNQHPPFFQNVKFLKNSRILDDRQPHQPQAKFFDCSKGYQKDTGLLSNWGSKNLHQIKEPKSNKLSEDVSECLEQKIEAYVEFVNELLQEMMGKLKVEKSSAFGRKKCLLQTLGKQLLRQAKSRDIHPLKNLSNSIQVSTFTSYASKAISRQLQRPASTNQTPEESSLLKLISQLLHQNSKLNQLISSHESKNIKMYVKMNDNESNQIQKCKKELASQYDKYKVLEKSLIKENDKYKKVCGQKKIVEKNVVHLEEVNWQLMREIQKLKTILDEINCQTMSKLSFEESHSNTILNFNLAPNNQKKQKHPQPPTHQQSQQMNSKMDRSFITKRDKASSCLSRHDNGQLLKKDEQIMSCSTITKTKNMKKKKPQVQQKVGVNLKDQFNEVLEEEVVGLRREVGLIKERLVDEVAGKSQLQRQIASLQQAAKKCKQKTDKMQVIINEQLSEIQKLIQLNKRLSSNTKAHTPPITTGQKSSQKEVSRGIQQALGEVRKLKEIKHGASQKGFEFSLSELNECEYRIIAMQAGVIEAFIGSCGE